MQRLSWLALAIFLCCILSACVPPKKDKSLDTTLQQYESMVRWSEWDGAVGFIAPEYLEENPISTLDLDRLRLFRVTTYAIRSATPVEDGMGYLQVVELRLFNRNNAVEKAIIDQQLWRYEEETERWLLHSGLPDVTRRY